MEQRFKVKFLIQPHGPVEVVIVLTKSIAGVVSIVSFLDRNQAFIHAKNFIKGQLGLEVK